jgi:hypothetical protein
MFALDYQRKKTKEKFVVHAFDGDSRLTQYSFCYSLISCKFSERVFHSFLVRENVPWREKSYISTSNRSHANKNFLHFFALELINLKGKKEMYENKL